MSTELRMVAGLDAVLVRFVDTKAYMTGCSNGRGTVRQLGKQTGKTNQP